MPFDSARRLRVRSQLRFQPKSDGTVVDQGHLHVGAEHAALDPWVLDARRRDEPFEQPPPYIRPGRCGKSRPQSVAGVGGESELRYEKEISFNLADTEVHFAVFVG